jgi:hypothetical protein
MADRLIYDLLVSRIFASNSGSKDWKKVELSVHQSKFVRYHVLPPKNVWNVGNERGIPQPKVQWRLVSSHRYLGQMF